MINEKAQTVRHPNALSVFQHCLHRLRSQIWKPWCRMSGPTWALLYFAVVFTQIVAVLGFLRYLTFYTNAWDLGIFQQALWTTGHDGRLLFYTAELPWNSSGSLLGVHWSPILFLLVPIYFVAPSPLTLMVIQSCAISMSAFPLYAILRKRTDPWISAGLCMVYLVSPPILGGLLFDFHVEAFIPVTALTTIYAWENRRYRLATFAAILLLSVIEFAPLILGGIGLDILVRRIWKRWHVDRLDGFFASVLKSWVPLAIVFLSIPMTILWFSFPKLISPGTPPISQIGPLGGSIVNIFGNVFTRPNLVLQSFFSIGREKLYYLGAIFASALFAWPLGIIDILPAVPWLFVVFISTDPAYATPVGNQYAFLVVPFLFPATVTGIGLLKEGSRRIWARLRKTTEIVKRSTGRTWKPSPSRPRIRRYRPNRVLSACLIAAIAIVLAALPSQILLSPLSPYPSYPWLSAGKTPTPEDRFITRIIELIPPNASVSAEPDLFPQVANRLNAYPYYHPGTQFIVVNVQSFWFTSALPPPDPPMIWYDSLKTNLTSPYGVLATGYGVLLLERDYYGPPVVYEPYNRTVPPAAFNLGLATVESNLHAPYGCYVEPTQIKTTSNLWFGPYYMVPPGKYVITSWVRPLSSASGTIRITAQIDDGRDVLNNLSISSSNLPATWSQVSFNVTIPYPAYLEIDGFGTGSVPSIGFGGSILQESSGQVRLG